MTEDDVEFLSEEGEGGFYQSFSAISAPIPKRVSILSRAGNLRYSLTNKAYYSHYVALYFLTNLREMLYCRRLAITYL